MSISTFFLLSTVGFAITSHAQQCSKPAKEIPKNMHLRDEYITQETFPDESSISFDCDAGYYPVEGSSQIKCSAGAWSPVLLKCQRKNCGPLKEVDHGRVVYKNGSLFGDIAEVDCKTGYMAVGKSGEIRCDVQGWTGRIPTCEAVQCSPPEEIVNGIYSDKKESYSYREVVGYTCNSKDLALNGSEVLTCSEDGKFSPAPPTCVSVECKDPQIKNAVWESGSRPPHRYQATVTYKCKSGYTMFGTSTLTCKMNSQWSSKYPECRSKGDAVVGGVIGALVTIPLLLVQNYWM